jgi:hypothetical protein
VTRLHSIFSGRLRIWWLTHRQDAVRAAQLVALVALFLTASTMDYQDQLDAERSAKAAVDEQLAQERAGRSIPSTVYMIEARTPAEAKMKLAEIEGAVMAERYRMRGAK